MPYKNKEGYTESQDALKSYSAIRESEVIALARRLRAGDMISMPVQIPTRSGEEKTVVRRMKVKAKYGHVVELWDAVSRRKRYTTYKELVLQKRKELEGRELHEE